MTLSFRELDYSWHAHISIHPKTRTHPDYTLIFCSTVCPGKVAEMKWAIISSQPRCESNCLFRRHAKWQ